MTDYCPGDPYLVALTDRHLGVVAVDEPSPEALAIAHEEAGFRLAADEGDDDAAERAAATLAGLIEEALPFEEAYMLRRAMDGASQRQIAAAVGIKQPSVHLRLTRAVAKLRAYAAGNGRPVKTAGARMTVPGLTAYAAKR